MMRLSSMPVTATPQEASILTFLKREAMLSLIPNWCIIKSEGIEQLSRVFLVNDYNQAMLLANKINHLSDMCDHHPTLIIKWVCLTLIWWSHAITGLHINICTMAAKTDEIYNQL
ncbi:MAG: 4a-hydroxytetrahydrobiopterin dehydratase [Porticoccaceae bacterium]|nr:4a-hydroxytetrahydrobiopterin dehydratase [Porticoccaceae bacterium]MDG1474876.1 4a-hydroxytetrahydrobiopterin dehydratase [Porticoccaceae bacterium]